MEWVEEANAAQQSLTDLTHQCVLGIVLTPADRRGKPGMSMVNWLSIGTHSQLKYWPSKLGSRRLGKASNRSAVSGMWFGEEIQGGSPELLIDQTQKRREQVPPEQLLRVTLSTLTQLSPFLQYCETKVLPNSMRSLWRAPSSCCRPGVVAACPRLLPFVPWQLFQQRQTVLVTFNL